MKTNEDYVLLLVVFVENGGGYALVDIHFTVFRSKKNEKTVNEKRK